MSANVYALLILALLAALLGAWLKSPTRIGAGGERRVARQLAKDLPPEEYRVINDLILPVGDRTTQIDHIVLSRFGIAVIETKTMSGWIFGDAEQSHWTQVIHGRKYRMQNPLNQNALHVRALSSLLAVPVTEIDNLVVFMGSARPKTAMLPSVLWGPPALGRRIRALRVPVYSEEQVARFEALLRAPNLASTRSSRRAHVQRLRARKHQQAESAQQCPRCSAPMVERRPRNGGVGFLGCSRFPQCRGTRPLPAKAMVQRPESQGGIVGGETGAPNPGTFPPNP